MKMSRYLSCIISLLSVATITVRHVETCEDSKARAEVNVTTVVVSGSSEGFSCVVRDVRLASWVLTQQQAPVYISVGRRIIGNKQNEYTLNVSTVGSTSANVSEQAYNLILNNVTEELGGTYTCKQEGCDVVNIQLSVEVLPRLWLQMDHYNISNTTINVTQSEDVSITCNALGGKPEVFLLWRVNGQIQTSGVTFETVPNGIYSILQYRPNLNDQNITCETSGQIAVPSLKLVVNVNVLYAPTCHILRHEESLSLYRVTCVCVANPPVSALSIFVNNNPPIVGNTVLLSVELPADIYCTAENAVGIYESPLRKYFPEVTSAATEETKTHRQQKLPALLTIIIVFVAATSVIVVTIVAIIILIQRRNIKNTSRDEIDGDDTSSHHYYHLPFQMSDVGVEQDVKYATYLHQDPNIKHEYFYKHGNDAEDEVVKKHKAEYLQIND